MSSIGSSPGPEVSAAAGDAAYDQIIDKIGSRSGESHDLQLETDLGDANNTENLSAEEKKEIEKKLNKRRQVINEIIETETTYVHQLEMFIEVCFLSVLYVITFYFYFCI